MKRTSWLIGAIVLLATIALILIRPFPFLFYPDLPYVGLLGLYRICRGPTGADRIVAIDILGIMIVGLCSILTISTGRSWYIDIGIAWALQSFIGTLALSKYLEGRDFDD